MSLPPSIFDFEQLKASFPAHYLDQGARSVDEGRVSSADYNAAQNLVTGRVRDSGRRIYQCIVRIGRDQNGALRVVGQCSCRIGYNCQHVAAVLCSMTEQRDRQAAENPLPDLPLELRKWLGHAKHLADQVSKPVSKEEPQCVVYLLRTDARFGLRRILVRAVKVRRLSAGGYGKATDFNILGRSTANFVTRDDHLITGLLGTIHDGNAGNEVELSEETGADVLRTIAVTGRGHWREPDGPVLRLAGAVTGRLVWHLDDDARQRVVLEAEHPGLKLIPLAPPWYLDTESGDCGPLETGLGDREAALLAMAPAVAPDAAAAVAGIAGEQLRSIGLPLPPCPERRRCKAVKQVPCLRLISEDLAAADLRQDWHPDPGPRWAHTAAMHFDYDGAEVNPRDDAPTLTRVDADVLLEIDRDRKAEAAAVATLKTLGLLERPGVHEQGILCFELSDDDAWLAFMDVGVPQLTARG